MYEYTMYGTCSNISPNTNGTFRFEERTHNNAYTTVYMHVHISKCIRKRVIDSHTYANWKFSQLPKNITATAPHCSTTSFCLSICVYI